MAGALQAGHWPDGVTEVIPVREAFPEWYGPTDAEIQRLYREATVVLDANVLLSLYRVTPTQRDEIFAVLSRVQDRLFVPYQAALEYQRNRLSVIHEQAGGFQTIRHEMEEIRKRTAVGYETHRVPAEIRSRVDGLLDGLLEDFAGRLTEIEASEGLSVEDAIRDDPVRKALDEILKDRVGAAPSVEVRTKRIAEAGRRAKEKIPPGYLDTEKSDPERAAGDFLLWQEVLDHASTTDRSVLLITNDQKDDWFQRIGGKTTGPRPELVAEMAGVTSHRYHQQRLQTFLAMTGKYLAAPVDAATIERVAPRAKRMSLGTFPPALNWAYPPKFDPATLDAINALYQPKFLGLFDAITSAYKPNISPAFLELAQTYPWFITSALASAQDDESATTAEETNDDTAHEPVADSDEDSSDPDPQT